MNSWKRFFIILALVSTLAFPDIRPVRAQDELPPVDATTAPDAETMASILVNSTEDTRANDGACTLREAIINSLAADQSGSTDCAAGNGNDMIMFELNLPATITLDSPLPDITNEIHLQGPGADQLSISGNNTLQILKVTAGASLYIQGINLANGHAGNGGAIQNQGYLNVTNCSFTNNSSIGSSGAIYNDNTAAAVIADSTFSNNTTGNAGGAIGNFAGSTLTITNSTFSGNSSNNNYGGGGGIYNTGNLIVEYCIFTGNTSTASSGAICNWNTAVISGSTFSNNTSQTNGGAIGNFHESTLNVLNSTFSGNSTGDFGGGAIYTYDSTSFTELVSNTFVNNTTTGSAAGGAISNGGNGTPGGTIILKNNLLAANLANGTVNNCHNEGGTLTDSGYNLENGNTCGFSGTSLINTNPLIRGLTDNGGPTPTHALRSDSPAIDRIPTGNNGCGTTLTTDQRGVARPLDGDNDEVAACDVGAYESDWQPGTIFTVNQSGDEGGPCLLQTSCTLRQAITSAQLLPASGDYEIYFDLPDPSTIVLGSTLPAITHHLTIEGGSPAQITISGNHAVRMFSIENTGILDLRSLTLADGHGGAIVNMGYLTAEYCLFSGNISDVSGGAIYNYTNAAALIRSSAFISNSSANAGGAIGNYNGATLNVINSTFSGNSTGGWGGGAIYNQNTSSTEIVNSTFVNNTASGSTAGGAIGNGGFIEPGGSVLLKNNLLVANLANGALQNCYNHNGSITDGGYNLENGNSCGFSGTSLINTNPLIRGLADNGGPTPTHALRSGSPAMDRIPYGTNGCGSLVLTDQRGVTRPRAGSNNGSYSCDIGAYEAINQVYMPLIVK